MATDGDDPTELAVSALFAAATELPLEASRELARRINEWVVIQAQHREKDPSQLASGDARQLSALRAIAEALGHPPTREEYERELERRRERGDGRSPTAAEIVKRFGGWAYALEASGLVGALPASALERSLGYQPRVARRYPDEIFEEALRACAAACGRPPLIRDYAAWRNDELARTPNRRPPTSQIPHHSSFGRRYASWTAALRAAGVASDGSDRPGQEPAPQSPG